MRVYFDENHSYYIEFPEEELDPNRPNRLVIAIKDTGGVDFADLDMSQIPLVMRAFQIILLKMQKASPAPVV